MTDPAPPAIALPVASVLPLLGLSHLDRPFDYAVSAEQDSAAQPGVRVRVRFSGRLVDGILLERLASSAHPGQLGRLERVVSPEKVVTPQVLDLCRAVAHRYAGMLGDVIRLAVPPRHARTEKSARDRAEAAPRTPPESPPEPDRSGWHAYRDGDAFLDVLAAEGSGRAAWQASPGEDWPARIVELAVITVRAGRAVVVVVPDQRDLDRVESACRAAIGDRVVALSAGLGPSARYRRWLRVLHGEVDVVVGTRSAGFAPAPNVGLIVVWDDGDDSLTEPRAPYPHAREVAVMRAAAARSSLVIGGFARTTETQALVESGWMGELIAERATIRARAPRIAAISDEDRRVDRDPLARVARIPSIAFDAARASLAEDLPVLISVPRRGYHTSLVCARCRSRVRCRRCRGPMVSDAAIGGPGGGPTDLTCRWCGRPESTFRCAECGDTHLRATSSGARRTAEELGRAFPGVPVSTSGGGHVLDSVPSGARVVVATPGAEPIADGRYGAAILVDTWAQLDRADLRVGEQTLRRWLTVLAGVRPAADGGRVVIVADASLPVVQAAVRWDPAGFAAAELRDRIELGLPPATTMVSVDGPRAAITNFVGSVATPDGTDVLGPVELPPAARAPAVRSPAAAHATSLGRRPNGPDGVDRVDGDQTSPERMLLRIDRRRGRDLVAALRTAQVARAAHRESGSIRVQVDPPAIG